MAVLRFEELDASAKHAACDWWRKSYELLIPIMQNDVVVDHMSTTAALTDEQIATEIITEGQGVRFRWNPDGSPGYE